MLLALLQNLKTGAENESEGAFKNKDAPLTGTSFWEGSRSIIREGRRMVVPDVQRGWWVVMG